MPSFKMGDLDPEKSKKTMQLLLGGSKDYTRSSRKTNSTGTSSYKSNNEIYEKMVEIEKKLDALLKNPLKNKDITLSIDDIQQPLSSNTASDVSPIEKPPASESTDINNLSDLDHIDSFTDELASDSLENSEELSKKTSAQTTLFPRTEPQLLLIPPDYFINENTNILNHDRSINWRNVLEIARKYKWLVNIYTVTRFFHKLNAIYKSCNSKMPGIENVNISQAWLNQTDKESILKQFGLEWQRRAIGKMGKTQIDLIDAFAYFQNVPKTSADLYSYLSQIDPSSYATKDPATDKDIKAAENNDLRRIRNQLTLFVKERVVEKSTGSEDKWFFRLI